MGKSKRGMSDAANYRSREHAFTQIPTRRTLGRTGPAGVRAVLAELLARKTKPIICLDLTGVTFIDAAGKAWLADRHRQGAKFVASDCCTKAIVDEITQGLLASAEIETKVFDIRRGIEAPREDPCAGGHCHCPGCKCHLVCGSRPRPRPRSRPGSLPRREAMAGGVGSIRPTGIGEGYSLKKRASTLRTTFMNEMSEMAWIGTSGWRTLPPSSRVPSTHCASALAERLVAQGGTRAVADSGQIVRKWVPLRPAAASAAS